MFSSKQTTPQKLLVNLMILHLLASSAHGIHQRCSHKRIECQCGSNQGSTVHVVQQQCSFNSRWRALCRPCENGIKLSEIDVCQKYIGCQSCQSGIRSCKSCPQGRFGSWCEKSCNCENGGSCFYGSENCVCPPGFQGPLCEYKTGCEVPTIEHPLVMKKVPVIEPLYLMFSCASSDFQLLGNKRVRCDKQTGHWSNQAPICVPVCRYPDTPLNGMVISDDQHGRNILSGLSIEFQCMHGFTLIGEPNPTCLDDSTWSHPTPTCSETIFCSPPPDNPHSTYTLITTNLPLFFSGTELVYSCGIDYFIIGAEQISCGQDGNWSSSPPLCVQVFNSEVDCNTLGSEVIDEVDSLVRIHCPPGCADKKTDSWSTDSFKDSFPVCQAAVLDGKISNTFGGSALVYNKGPNHDFAESSFQSERLYDQPSRFQFHPESNLWTSTNDDCPNGWSKISDHCALVVLDSNNWKYAKGICHNLGARLLDGEEFEGILQIIETASQRSGLDEFWVNSDIDPSMKREAADGLGPLSAKTQQAHLFNFKNEDDFIPISNISTPAEEDESSVSQYCTAMQFTLGNLTQKSLSCQEILPFICVFNQNERQNTCEDPGHPDNGLAVLENPSQGYRRGAVLTFKCNDPYVLKGKTSITCLSNLSWSSNIPVCIKVVQGCVDPPTIKFGSFEIQTEDLGHISRVPTSRITGERSNRLGGFTPPKVKRSSDPGLEDDPKDYHIVGARAVYACESRYYEMKGSKTRRCLKDGTWSGQGTTCLPICGRSDSSRTPFIINGNISDIGQWPWQIGLGYWFPSRRSYELLCGATLINELWVLTAAHCVTEDYSTVLFKLDTFQVYAGKYHRNHKLDDEFVQVRKVSEVHIHPDYNEMNADADIALIRLEKPVVLSTRVQPVCLPNNITTMINLNEGTKGVVTGWGLTENSSASETIRQAVVPVVSKERCEKGYSRAGMSLTVTKNMYCAGLEAGTADTCSGDSGGPMVFQVETGQGRSWVLEGVISWGSLRGCGLADQYSGYTRVNRFLDWIKRFI